MSETVVGAYWGLGWLHGYYRPMQTLLLTTAARGEMSRRLVAKDDLVHMDALVHRHGIIEAGKRSVDQLPNPVASWVDAYLMGISSGLRKAPLPWEFRMLATKIPAPDRASLISSMLIAGFLGLAESQERMERALIESVREGADASLLEAMFSPHLSGWDPHVARDLSISEAVGSSNQLVFPVSGSNAWAVDSRWTNSSNNYKNYSIRMLYS